MLRDFIAKMLLKGMTMHRSFGWPVNPKIEVNLIFKERKWIVRCRYWGKYFKNGGETRYFDAPVCRGFVKKLWIEEKGAIASSVAHDSHNIIAVGTNDESICNLVNIIIEHEGFDVKTFADANDTSADKVRCQVAGLMSNEDGYKVQEMYTEIDKTLKLAGSKLSAPFQLYHL